MNSVFFACLAACLASAEVVVPNGAKIAFMGDSITEYGNCRNSYIDLVLDGLKRAGVSAEKISAGIAGQMAAQMDARFEKDVLAKGATWVTIMAGVNDAMIGGPVPVEKYVASVRSMVDKALAKGVTPVVLTPTLQNETRWRHDARNDTLQAYSDALKRMAGERKVLVADVHAAFRAAFEAEGEHDAFHYTCDNCHMSAYGNELLAATVLAALGVDGETLSAARKAWKDYPRYERVSVFASGATAADRAAALTEKLRRMKADYPNMKFILGASPYYGQPVFDEFNARMLRLVDNRTYFWAEGTANLQGRLERREAAPRRAIGISRTNPRYFETADGRTWIPIGMNICFDRLYDGKAHGDAEVRANFDRWIRAFAANGGNCIRLWAGHKSLEVMPDEAGKYDPEKTKTLKGVVALCEELGVRVKITLESFRSTCADAAESRQPFFNRKLYAPYAKDMAEFYASEKCFDIYMGKVRYLKELGLGDSPAVYCWELWNEINATAPMADYAPWSARALAELRRMFPRQMTVNNLGSFSDVGAYQMYDELATETDNDFLQVHRYLDAGACLDVCRGPMDVVAASAVREMLARRADCPAILAETGAVQANHAGPFRHYASDKEGTLLHDALFAAFFAGSAGCGQYWHWDHQYVDGLGLWWHFRRFANAIEGLDPVAEDFRPFYTESQRLRMYGLRGRTTSVVWCRDKASDWESELVRGVAPETRNGECVPFRGCALDCYLPWEDRRVTVPAPALPPFRRSIVVRVPSAAVEGVVRPH